MRSVSARHALRRPGDAARLDLCQIGRNAVSLGAATLALEGFLAPVDAVNRRHTGRKVHAPVVNRWSPTT